MLPFLHSLKKNQNRLLTIPVDPSVLINFVSRIAQGDQASNVESAAIFRRLRWETLRKCPPSCYWEFASASAATKTKPPAKARRNRQPKIRSSPLASTLSKQVEKFRHGETTMASQESSSANPSRTKPPTSVAWIAGPTTGEKTLRRLAISATVGTGRCEPPIFLAE